MFKLDFFGVISSKSWHWYFLDSCICWPVSQKAAQQDIQEDITVQNVCGAHIYWKSMQHIGGMVRFYHRADSWIDRARAGYVEIQDGFAVCHEHIKTGKPYYKKKELALLCFIAVKLPHTMTVTVKATQLCWQY